MIKQNAETGANQMDNCGTLHFNICIIKLLLLLSKWILWHSAGLHLQYCSPTFSTLPFKSLQTASLMLQLPTSSTLVSFPIFKQYLTALPINVMTHQQKVSSAEHCLFLDIITWGVVQITSCVWQLQQHVKILASIHWNRGNKTDFRLANKMHLWQHLVGL